MKSFKLFLVIGFVILIFASSIDIITGESDISQSALYFSFGFVGCSESNNGTEPEPEEPELVIAPLELYFGRIPEGHNALRQYKLSNIGRLALNITSFGIEGANAGQFVLSGNPAQIEIPPFSSVVYEIEFSPGTNGNFTAQISLDSNADTSPDNLPLNGIGTAVAGDAFIFERIIGNLDSDGSSSVARTADGGYVLAGSTADTLEGWGIAELTRLNMFGDVLWRKQFAGDGTSSFAELLIEDDGSIIAVGQTASAAGRNKDIFVVKTDAQGNEIWETIFGDTDIDDAHDIIKTEDDGYLLAAETNNTTASGGIKDAMLVKIDGAGNVLWNILYGTTEGEDARSVAHTSDGGYVFTGLRSVGAGEFDIYFIKTDANGTQLWEKTYPQGDVANSVAATSDNGFILAGFTVTQGAGGRDVVVVKTNSAGDVLWTQTIGGIANDAASEVIQTSDQGYLIVGSTGSFGAGGNDVYLIKLDNSGAESWVRYYGGTRGDVANSVLELSGNGYVVTGTTSSYSGGSNIYVLKLKADGTF